jgi:hypothetical protein
MAVSLFGQTVGVKTDKFTGKSWILIDCGEQSRAKDRIFLNRYVRLTLYGYPGRPSFYQLDVNLSQDSWLFIEKGKSLTFKIDNTFVPLDGYGSVNSRDVIVGNGIEEHASYNISLDQLHQIVSAKAPVEFRLEGEKGFCDETLSPKAIKAMNEFLAKVPAGDWTLNGNQITPLAPGPEPAPVAALPTTTKGALRAGIHFIPGATALHVLGIDPGSPNTGLLNQFIVAVEGERGTGPELQAKLNAAIARHQDGSPLDVTSDNSTQGPGEKGTITLF